MTILREIVALGFIGVLGVAPCAAQANLDGSGLKQLTATREAELMVRTALGASRRRIITQLFAEALVLTAAGAGTALAALSWGLRRASVFVWSLQTQAPPFWYNDHLNPVTILYIAVLTLLAAIVTGVLPALRFTRGGVEAGGIGQEQHRVAG